MTSLVQPSLRELSDLEASSTVGMGGSVVVVVEVVVVVLLVVAVLVVSMLRGCGRVVEILTFSGTFLHPEQNETRRRKIARYVDMLLLAVII